MIHHKTIRIGALVGMGPNSTSPFYDRVIHYARSKYGAKSDMDFPEILMLSLPTPFYPDQEIDHVHMRAQLKRGIDCLQQAQVDFIVIPCNTAHQYYDFLQNLIEIPILNLIDLTLADIKVNTTRSVALIATQATIESKLYQDKMTAKNLKFLHSAALQAQVNRLLVELKKTNPISAQTKTLWQNLLHELENLGCSQAIVACTDISPCIPLVKTPIQLIDSNDRLACATITEYLQRRAEI